MGTIVSRKLKDGTPAYMARIRVMRNGKTHAETETFTRKQAAQAWIKKRETELHDDWQKATAKDPTLAEVINQYLDESIKRVGRTKRFTLAMIANGQLGGLRCSELDSVRLIAYAKDRAKVAKPQTVTNDIAILSSVFSVAEPAWGYPLSHMELVRTRIVMKKLGLYAKPNKRDRLPTVAELNALLAYFHKRKRMGIDMVSVILFAMHSGRRLSEIVRIEWADFDGQSILVRELKHPTMKETNHVRCNLPNEAVKTLQNMPRIDPRIFPYKAISVAANYQRACKSLGIEGLTFHDLRHLCASWLFSLGNDIPYVASVTGHASWQDLKRYTHIKGKGDILQGLKNPHEAG